MSTEVAPSVTIFVPTYNAEKYAAETVKSLLSQDYENFNIIISDDASTDGTARILEEFKTAFPSRISLFIQPKNLGITNNCNFLLKKVTGDYVCIVGGDDTLEPNCISRSIDCAIQTGASAVFHLHSIIDENSKLIEKTHNFKSSHLGTIDDFVKRGVYPHANGMLIKASHFPSEGFDAALPYASDFDFILQTLRNGASFFALKEYLSSYRKHGQSITATKQYECNIDTIKAYEKLREYREIDQSSLSVTISGLQRAIRKYDVPARYAHWLRKSIVTDPRNYKSVFALAVYAVTLGKVRL